ncbi:hypothetical protein AHMF7605_15455 [Adhaeribacter arboris]|uniref:MotA/TolQ/ExbB proton channel domain-containing protein n=1 Tax=Adhaeribacter arboris TaxID=2072846 RepID=A0A2T2YH27_9BACT|nr:hypothetical protein [Adhaeribacter arboris]PSR54800.1 hypothetical protein AHMF7605_15455 [Adhaeribacter arboris]
MFEILLEAAIIIGIVCFQGYVFLQNRQKINRVVSLYPDKKQLWISKEFLNASGNTAQEVKNNLLPAQAEKLQLLEQGKKFLFLHTPSEIHRVTNLNNRGEQVEIRRTVYDGFASNSETYYIPYIRLVNLATDNEIEFVGLKTEPETSGPPLPERKRNTAPEIELDLIAAGNCSREFLEILNDTNNYLRNNKGAAADFNILKDISERQSEVLEKEINAIVATPLYVGLLGTFLGVIFGLSGIILGGGVTNEAIQTFITGVVVAMVGSFFGLLLTLWGNTLFKNARFIRDRHQNDYYTFLQAQLLPRLHSDMAGSLSSLKAVLDAFNREFLDKVADFKPIIAGITANIEVQKNFLQKLEEIGYDQMAKASLQVFDKVTQSTEEFQKFLGYQQALNQSLEAGAGAAASVQSILERLTGFERGINNVGQYIGQHDNLIQKQLDFFGTHEKEMADISAKIEQYFDQAAGRLTELMDARMRYLEQDAQNAYERWSNHFEALNRDNIYERVVQYLEPFKKLNTQQDELSREINQTQRTLLQKMDRDAETQARLLRQLEHMNQNLDKVTQPGMLKKLMDKMFK